MVLCLTCQKTKVLPRCSTLLTIGRINHISQDIFIFIKNVTTGYPIRQSRTSSVAGVVTIDMADPAKNFFSQNHTYEVWVTFQDTTIEERLPIELGGSTSECFILEFEAYYATENTAAVYATYQLQLDSDITTITPIMDFDTNGAGNYNLDSVTPANVERWINKAQNNDANQTVTGNRPAFTAAGLIGQSTFTFDSATAEHFVIDDFVYTRSYFHFMILLNATTGDIRPIFGQGDAASVPFHYLVMVGGDELEYSIGAAAGTYQIRSEGASMAGAFHVVEAVFDGSHTTLSLDGVPLQLSIGSSFDLTEIPEITNDLLIGGRDTLGTIAGFEGQMRCYKVWDEEITATQRQDEVLRMLAKI